MPAQAFLYRWVHSHHHKSYNPTAWSGISMTPVESTAYFSAALIPLLFASGSSRGWASTGG